MDGMILQTVNRLFNSGQQCHVKPLAKSEQLYRSGGVCSCLSVLLTGHHSFDVAFRVHPVLVRELKDQLLGCLKLLCSHQPPKRLWENTLKMENRLRSLPSFCQRKNRQCLAAHLTIHELLNCFQKAEESLMKDGKQIQNVQIN